MRVAVHFPGGAVAAYRYGRIIDTHHPVTGDPIARDEIVAGLLKRAAKEFPGCDIRLERLHDNGDGTSKWVPPDHQGFLPVGGGQTSDHAIIAAQDQEAGAD